MAPLNVAIGIDYSNHKSTGLDSVYNTAPSLHLNVHVDPYHPMDTTYVLPAQRCNIDGFVQDCSIPSVKAPDILQSCPKTSIYGLHTSVYSTSREKNAYGSCFVVFCCGEVAATNIFHILQDLQSLKGRLFIGIWIRIVNLRRSSDRLRFIMGIPIPLWWRVFNQHICSCYFNCAGVIIQLSHAYDCSIAYEATLNDMGK